MTHIPIRRLSRKPRWVHLAMLLVTSAAALTWGMTAGATSATAHDSLLSASPEADSTTTEIPAEVTLTFSDEVFTAGSAVQIAVIAPDGEDIVAGSPAIDGNTVSQPITETATPGTFTVQWRVVSSDGHPISDEYTYTLAQNTGTEESTPSSPSSSEADQDPAPSSTAAATQPADVHSGPREGTEFLPIMTVIAGVGVVGGALVSVMMVARARRRRDRADANAATKTVGGSERNG